MSKSEKRIRTKRFFNTLLVIIVITLFISTAIIAIIYTQGGKITLRGIVESGSIRLEIQPDDKENLVYIDGKLTKSDERLINNITPGLHTIRIESTKFHSWEKVIEISPTYVTNIQVKLFPLEPELTQLTQTNISKLFFSDDGSYAYYLVNDSLVQPDEQGLWRQRLEEQELFFRRNSDPEKILSFDESVLSYFEDPELEVKIDYSNNKMLIINPTNKTVTLFDPSKSNSPDKLININEQIGFYPTRVNWFNNDNSIIVSNDEIIIEYNTVNKEKTIVDYMPNTKPIYDTNGEVLYLYTANNKINRYQNKVAEIFEAPENLLLGNLSDLRLAKDGSSIIIKNDTGFYYYEVGKEKFIKVSDSGEILDISFDGTSILFNKNNQIVFTVVDKSLIDKSLLVQSTSSMIDVTLKPKFINNSNLVIINNYPLKKMQVSENDGSNIIDILSNTAIDNGYYKFQKDGSSLTLMIEDTSEENVLNNYPLKKMQVSENDGSNIIDILSNTAIDNGYYKFQKDGSSLTLMIEDSSEENVLNKNLFKLVLNTSSLPFNL